MMAYYNSGFPATYQPIYPTYAQPYTQQAQATPQTQQPQQSSIIWVQGEAGAKSYLVAPNNTVQLWDSEAQTIYLKSADASGMPSMKILDYTIRETGQNAPVMAPNSQADYATKADVEALRGQIDSLKMRIGKLNKKEAESDE